MRTDFHQQEKPLIIPVFIMNGGCPKQCIFCNEKIAAGNFAPEVSKSSFEAEVDAYLRWNKDKLRQAEIAFYGGNFTGLPPDDQRRLLSWAGVYLRKGLVESIRISTRPDYISDDQLNLLHAYGVRTVEIGIQSMDDEVLRKACRGHDSEATVHAMKLLCAHGFQTGVHLMAGLPGDTRESFLKTLARVSELRPDTARIHPVLVFRDTPLAEEFKKGHYQPLSVDEAVEWCRLAWETLSPAGIRIIRFGLHVTPDMGKEGAVLAGPLHPAFGSLVYSAIYYSAALRLLRVIPQQARRLHFRTAYRALSSFRGERNRNINAIKKLYPNAQIVIDSASEGDPGRLSLITETGESHFLDIPGII